MLLSSVVLPLWLDHDINGYPILMIILSIVAIPLLLLEYFYTKERVIEDGAEEVGAAEENRIPILQQMKALVTNKYWVITFILMTIIGVVDNFKGGNVQYFYIKYLLDGETNYGMYTLYQVVTGIPLGLGAIIAYPIAKKVGIKNMSIFGYTLVLIGSVLGLIFPSNLPVVFVAGFLRQFGMIPNAYVFGALVAFGFDSIEHRSGFRLEGLMGVAIFGMLQSAIFAPFAGGYESTILKMGFVDAPLTEGGYISDQIKNFMSFSFYGFDIVLALANIILLPFVDIESKMNRLNKNLLLRQKQACLARGEEWIEPEERQRRDDEENRLLAEENRIADLKERCKKKGLDFDAENEKYLKAKAEKDRKWAEKQKQKEEKKRLADEQAAELDRIAEEDRIEKLKKYCNANGLIFEEEEAKYQATLTKWENVKKAKAARREKELDRWEEKDLKNYELFQTEKYEGNVKKDVKALAKAKKREEKRIIALKKKCLKHGLDFESENKKYLAEQQPDKLNTRQ